MDTMMTTEGRANANSESLSLLVGRRLVRSRNFLATRHFYFGRNSLEDAAGLYTLGVECPWRIRKDDMIVVGSEDYYERAEDNLDETWQAGTSTGHLQNQKLAELLGEVRGDCVINTGTGMVVQSVQEEPCKGLRIGLTEGYTLEVFPASRSQMEWIFMIPGQRSLVLMNGVVNRTTGNRTHRP